jgi:hypothetical protein
VYSEDESNKEQPGTNSLNQYDPGIPSYKSQRKNEVRDERKKDQPGTKE